MSSPRKRSKNHSSQGRSLTEPQLPLHIALAWIIDRVFPLNDDCQPVPVYSQGFIANILRIIAREVLEVGSKPGTYVSLRDELDPIIRKETKEISKRNDKKRNRGQKVQEEFEDVEKYTSWMSSFGDKFLDVAEGCAFLDRLEKELRDRLNYSDDDEPTEFPEPIERHSPIGVFARNLLNTLRKLSFDETTHLSREVAKWCGHETAGPSIHAGIWSLDRRSGMEDSLDKRMKAMQDYQAANSSGDYSNALASLRRFYDYQFPSSGRGQHQHALLNIASFHHSTGGMESAQAAIDEAIRVARTAGDKPCLEFCLSLAQRINMETSSVAYTPSETIRINQKPVSTSRLPEGHSPMDQLWSIKPALDLGEPVHIAFRRIHSSQGKDIPTERPISDEERSKPTKQWRTGQKLDMASWHATQASLWSMLGSGTLADFHEDSALGDLSPWNDGRLTVVLSKAQRAVERAEYDSALSMLLDMSVIQGMSISSYHRWARVVWKILERRCKMHGDQESLSYLSSLQPPSTGSQRQGPGGPQREIGHPDPIPLSEDLSPTKGIKMIQEHIRGSLFKAQKLQSSATPSHLILPHVLSATQLSSELGLWQTYRFGTVILCEVLLSMEGMSMAEKVIKEIDNIWDQVLGGDDFECIARGEMCLGKAKLELALDNESADLLDQAVVHIQQSLEFSTKLEYRSLMLESTSLLTLLAELRSAQDGQSGERDSLADRYMTIKSGDGNVALKEQVKLTGEIVKMVGVRVAEGWK
ncbi:uncharacterized protein IL334_002496 [Kwoniella shivajii]|uniref:Anaphase-promoting complex subunit 5 n=1 Tax=Kwoniella shivajii TaxID=564305 RepID=A0ABZ1CV93_9TREE|nr:hypothetical protein IL334_002496 [Kwoniella shivajii]